MFAAGTKDTIATKSMFHMTGMEGQVKVIAVETQSRPLGLPLRGTCLRKSIMTRQT